MMLYSCFIMEFIDSFSCKKCKVFSHGHSIISCLLLNRSGALFPLERVCAKLRNPCRVNMLIDLNQSFGQD